MSRKKVDIRARKGDLEPSSLLGDILGKSVAPLRRIDLEQLQPNAFNPRRHFDDEGLKRLALSIQEDGLLEPLVVRQVDSGFEVIAGARRFRALQLVGETAADCKVLSDISEEKARLLALVENLNREDLSPIEEVDAVVAVAQSELGLSAESEVVRVIKAARNYERRGRLTDGLSVETITVLQHLFQRIGINSISSFVANRLQLLNLPEDLLDSLRANRISLAHTKSLVRISDAEERKDLVDAVASGITTRELAARVNAKLQLSALSPTNPKKRLLSIRKRLTSEVYLGLPKEKQLRLDEILSQLDEVLQ